MAVSPSGSPSAQSQSIRKGGHDTQLGRRCSGKNAREERGPYQAGSSLACGVPCSMGALGEEPRDTHGDPTTSAVGLRPPQNSLPFYPFIFLFLPVFYLPDPYLLVLWLKHILYFSRWRVKPILQTQEKG